MDDGVYQWDDAKAASNYAKHGVTFEAARDAFNDPFALEWADEERTFGEPRFSMLAVVEGHVLFVAYAMRGESIRIISARPAEPFERRKHHEQS